MKRSKHEAIEILFNNIIRIFKENDYYVAIDPLTYIADVGSSEEEALKNLKQAIYEHFEAIEILSAQDKDLDIEMKEIFKGL